MLKKYFLVFTFFLSSASIGQASKIDSLKIVDVKQKLNKILFEEIPKIPSSENDKIIETYNFAESLTNEKLSNYIVYINNSRGFIYEKIGNKTDAIKNFDKAYKTAVSFGDKIGSARSLQAKAILYGKEAKYDSTAKYLDRSIEITKKNLYNPIIDSTKNKVLLMNLLSNYALVNLYQKKHKENLSYSLESLKFAQELNNKQTQLLCLGYIGDAYLNMENNEKALEFYFKENKIASEIKNEITYGFSNLHLSAVYNAQKEYKKSIRLTKEALAIFIKQNHLEGILNSKQRLFTTYRLSENFDEALHLKNEIIMLLQKSKNQNYLLHFYIELGEIYTRLNNFEEAKRYFDLSKDIIDLNPTFDKTFYFRKYSDFLKKQGNDKEALESKTKELETYKKQIDTDLINSMSKFEAKYKVAEKELTIKKNEIKIKTQEFQLEKEKTNRNLALSGVALLVVLSGGGFLFFKNKQKTAALQTQNTLLELQQNLVESELQSLNKQLDPHEIKNLLASISPEIQEKAPESYKKMLKLFNLTKASLNSNTITDTVENQMQQIEDFLSLEKSMLPMPLAYSISNSIQDTQTQIPRLLLKNLVENAIKHGIKKQENGGEIVVKLEQIDTFINLTVDDTGIGRQHAISLDSGIGTSTYLKLFTTLNTKNKEKATFEIIDKEQGTKVEVKIPIDYKYS